MADSPKLPGIPPIPAALAWLIQHRQGAARYLRALADRIEGGSVQAFDIAWGQSREGPPTGQLLVDASKLVVPVTAPKVNVVTDESYDAEEVTEETAIVPYEDPRVFDMSDSGAAGIEEDEPCDSEECDTCHPDETDPDLSKN